jgi:hypothetical protein
MVNAAWRKFQTYLSQLGHSRFKRRTVLFNLPKYAATDPSQQCALSWTYYFDGVSFYFPPASAVLPQDFILPLKIWERHSATGNNAIPFPSEPMGQALDGLPNRPYPQAWNGVWEWRDDAIYFPGSQYAMDLEVEYAAFLPDFNAALASAQGVANWYDCKVPIMRCLSPFSLYLCAEVSVGRADMDTATFKTEAEDETKQLFNIEAKQKQRTTTSRKRFSSQIRPSGNCAGRSY